MSKESSIAMCEQLISIYKRKIVELERKRVNVNTSLWTIGEDLDREVQRLDKLNHEGDS